MSSQEGTRSDLFMNLSKISNMDVVGQALELTRQFIQTPSESSGQTLTETVAPEAAMERKVLDFAQRAGLHAFSLPVTDRRSNVIIECKGHGPRLLVVGHMDTVSAKGMDDPFSAEIQNGCITGRGACDDKGPLACALSVLAWIKLAGLVPAFDIIFAATVDEECTLAGAEKLASWVGSFDLCLALEPTELQIICAHKGDLRLRISTTGKAAHSSSPEKGVNAIDKMLPVIEALSRLRQRIEQQPEHSLCGKGSLSFTSLHAGSSSNIIPDDCFLTVDIRLLPEDRPEEVYEEVRGNLPDGVSLDLLFAGQGIQTDFNHPIIRRLSAIIEDDGILAGPGAAPYATDCCRLAERGPCIVWGPGSIAQAHRREEFIETEQIARAVGILQQFFCAE